MKTKAFFFLSISIALFGFIAPPKTKTFVPPGTVIIQGNTFMDETEISNISWQEYMYWTKNKHGEKSDIYLATKPDSAVWEEPMLNLYISHPAYRDYPIVGVTWQQANDYCEWRSDRVMERILILQEDKPKMIVPSKITYRLPTPAEWESVAKAGYLEKTQSKLNKKYPNCNKANFKQNNMDDDNSTTSPVYQYWPNSYGVYNILGNVAEMTTENGVAKGGSWKQLEDNVSVDKNFAYQKAENWVGFRCICEVMY